jgi:solute carrier family 35 (UDP-galactose transporter), member B1
MFTMILSVIVYNHALTKGQWLGAATVFAGISVEAWVKRKGELGGLYTIEILVLNPDVEIHAKRIIQEKAKARIKQL